MDFAALGTPMANTILKNLPYVIFLGFLGTIYIANVHYAENTMRKIDQLEKEITDLRWKYMSEKSELMYNSTQSRVSSRVKSLKLSTEGKKPFKIVIKKDWEFNPNGYKE